MGYNYQVTPEGNWQLSPYPILLQAESPKPAKHRVSSLLALNLLCKIGDNNFSQNLKFEVTYIKPAPEHMRTSKYQIHP
jgi:hypothetical protein